MNNLNSYKVPLHSEFSDPQYGILKLARREDMPCDWTFRWENLEEDERIYTAQMVWDDHLLGLVRYLKFDGEIYISHIEANPNFRSPSDARKIQPIGKWLIWYVIIQISHETEFTLTLDSTDDAFDYYRDKVGMKYVGDASTPSESLTQMELSSSDAHKFIEDLHDQYGPAVEVAIS
jgi:hypothetical protein